MAALLGAAFFAASILLLGIKMMTEKKGNIRKVQFLNCMGMKKADRAALFRSEIRTYYILTVAAAGAVSVGLVYGIVAARLYAAADAKRFLGMLIPSAVCEMAFFGIITWLLTEWNIRQIEKKAGEV